MLYIFCFLRHIYSWIPLPSIYSSPSDSFLRGNHCDIFHTYPFTVSLYLYDFLICTFKRNPFFTRFKFDYKRCYFKILFNLNVLIRTSSTYWREGDLGHLYFAPNSNRESSKVIMFTVGSCRNPSLSSRIYIIFSFNF